MEVKLTDENWNKSVVISVLPTRKSPYNKGLKRGVTLNNLTPGPGYYNPETRHERSIPLFSKV